MSSEEPSAWLRSINWQERRKRKKKIRNVKIGILMS
jgi:hypothetical protein